MGEAANKNIMNMMMRRLMILILSLSLSPSPSMSLRLSNTSDHAEPEPTIHALSLKLSRTPEWPQPMLVVNLSLGTPPVEVVVLMDTGSSLTWTRCEPCSECFPLRTPKYSSIASATFQDIPCFSPILGYDPISFPCAANKTLFNISYGDGPAATETFLFPGGVDASVVFGCARVAKAVSQRGAISGILGLGQAPESLLLQAFPEDRRRFSYCFSPFGDGERGSTTIMTFGDDVYRPRRQFFVLRL